jgi:hypothetical protein
MAASAARLSELVRPEVAAIGYDLEALTVTAAGKRSVVRVIVDKDGGVTLDDVADVSRPSATAWTGWTRAIRRCSGRRTSSRSPRPAWTAR